MARARDAGLKITPRQVFEHPRIDRLAAHALPLATVAAQPEIHDRDLPLTPVQRRFLARNPQGPGHWTQAVVLELADGLGADAVAAALDVLTARHDALRLRFHRDGDGTWHQRLTAAGSRPVQEELAVLEELAVIDAAMDAAALRLQAAIDITSGPLVAAGLFRRAAGPDLLMIAIHHLAVDGVSWRVLVDELGALLADDGTQAVLPAPTTPWSHWTHALAGHCATPSVQAEADWWRRQLTGAGQVFGPARSGCGALWIGRWMATG
ncbi:condensation domain-containing protein [Tistrella bauzanensis]